MDKCGICLKPAVQLFETGKDGVYACFKCQPLVPEVTIGDPASDVTDPRSSNTEEKSLQLQNHLRNHRAERRFVCTYCNKAQRKLDRFESQNADWLNREFKVSSGSCTSSTSEGIKSPWPYHGYKLYSRSPQPYHGDKVFEESVALPRLQIIFEESVPLPRLRIVIEEFVAPPRLQIVFEERAAHADVRSPLRGGAKHPCGVCGASLAGEGALRQHLAQHVVAHAQDAHAAHDEKEEFACVFASCGARFASPREHTEHLLRAHQLRVLTRTHTHPPRRGRPPKNLKDPLDLKDSSIYDEVKIIKQEPQYLPKLKVQSLFQ
ncbi:unnamed protein product, partial [Iphiclides podalirius]